MNDKVNSMKRLSDVSRHALWASAALLCAIRDRLPRCDALFMTGGVSAGTHDFVPAALGEDR